MPVAHQNAIVPLDQVTVIGRDLNRPESVHVAADGTLQVSHRGAGVSRIDPGGHRHLCGQEDRTANGHELIPNGIAPLPDGGYLVANIGEGGGVWRLSPQGVLTPHLMEVDGVFLAAANFVKVDGQGRVWITVSTVSQPRFKAYTDKVSDGLIIVQDGAGARIVADDICFANECRIGPSGRDLYVSETFGRRVARYDLAADGTLSNKDVFSQFGQGDFPDGCRFDAAGHLWLTCIVSNRIYRIAPNGDARLVLEDLDPAHVDWVEEALAEGRMGREHFYRAGGAILGNVASIDFSADGRRAYMGSLCGTGVTTFELPPELRGDA
ncbi:SMP-30/gluconolactonase/LRE family protein [Rhodospirillum sp. A1_3_36]|uniref:SMP-30/gluconolactonase/LRE family protein n=1 Tax=Rhodospirillum sp. A1_3_36 TaxID=3391666 RepID=UPI0039A425E7